MFDIGTSAYVPFYEGKGDAEDEEGRNGERKNENNYGMEEENALFALCFASLLSTEYRGSFLGRKAVGA
jgi:hypothetical protein